MNNLFESAPTMCRVTSDTGIKVSIHIPKKVSESVEQRKINIIYDILSKAEKNA